MSLPNEERISAIFTLGFVVFICLSGFLMYFNSLFVLPQFLEKKQQLFALLQTTEPATLAILQQKTIFKLLDWAAAPTNLLIEWWFVVIPLITLPFSLIMRSVDKLPNPARAKVVITGLICAFSVLLAYLQTFAIGIGGAILIAYWKM